MRLDLMSEPVMVTPITGHSAGLVLHTTLLSSSINLIFINYRWIVELKTDQSNWSDIKYWEQILDLADSEINVVMKLFESGATDFPDISSLENLL